jgi:hypothetical protein
MTHNCRWIFIYKICFLFFYCFCLTIYIYSEINQIQLFLLIMIFLTPMYQQHLIYTYTFIIQHFRSQQFLVFIVSFKKVPSYIIISRSIFFLFEETNNIQITNWRRRWNMCIYNTLESSSLFCSMTRTQWILYNSN